MQKCLINYIVCGFYNFSGLRLVKESYFLPKCKHVMKIVLLLINMHANNLAHRKSLSISMEAAFTENTPDTRFNEFEVHSIVLSS